MRRLILFIFTFLLFSMNGFAAIIRDVVIDGVGYSLDKGIKTATVVDDDALRAETFSIPETITVDGVVYTVTAIQTNAFYSNSKLQKIVIPKTIKTIGEYAFVNCRELATVTLSEGLEIIGFSAFNGTAITDIMIPSTVKELSAYSFPYEFYNNGQNDVCKFESYIVAAGNAAYASHDGILYDAAKQNIISVPPYIKGDVSLPASLIEFNYAISSPYLVSLTIPRGVRSITYPTGARFAKYIVDKNNQYYCSFDDGILYGVDNGSLTEIKHVPMAVSGAISIAEGITEIGWRTFSEHGKITSVKLPASVTSIDSYAFSGCTALADINLDNVNEIGGGAFAECTSLTNIEISKVRIVGSRAFSNCTGLVKVYYNAEEFPAKVFDGCINLNDITLGDNVSKIYYGAFDNTGWLAKQPNGAIYIKDFFYGFKGAAPETLKLKEGTKKFAADWWKNVPYLTTLELNSDIDVIDANLGDFPIDNLVITGPVYFNIGTLVTNKNMNIHVKTAAMPFLNAYNKSFDGGGVGAAYPTQTVFGENMTDKNLFGTLYIPKGLRQRYIDVIEKKVDKYSEYYTFAYFASDIQEQYDVTDYKEDTSDGIKYSFDYSINLATVIGVENEALEEANIGGVITHDCREFEVRVINANAFENNANLRKVSILSSVVKAGANAFRNCKGLKEVYYDCNINIDSYNQEVGEGEHFGVKSMFRHCVLDKMVLGKHVTRQLEYLYDPGEGRYFPEGWLLVKHFEVDNDNTRYTAVDGALYSKDMSTLIRAPYKESIIQTRSGQAAPELHIVEGVSTIGEMALTSTNYDIYVPHTVMAIDVAAFKDCSATLHVEWATPIEFNSSFSMENMTIVVPDMYVSSYQGSATWKDAKEIVGNSSYTGIDSKIIESQATSEKCYDLLGRRVKGTPRNIPYIMNKRKFIPLRK